MSEPARGADQRLGLYIDAPFTRKEDGSLLCGHEVAGFLRFAAEIGRRFRSFTVIARSQPLDGAVDDLGAPIRLAPLPGYPSLRDIAGVIRAVPGTARGMWSALDELDVVWASAPYPFALLLVVMAKARGKRVVLLFRQDGIRYYRNRLPSRAWTPLLGPLAVLTGAFRLLALLLPSTVVGEGLASQYRFGRRPYVMHVSLVEKTRIPPPDGHEISPPVELLTVGRLAPEKGPFVWADALAELERRHPGRYRARWVGDGPLADRLARRLDQLGLASSVKLDGYVPFGEKLWRRYGESDMFVHVALTEGAPGALIEALASGLPTVATDVGGVKGLLGAGKAGLLVPPSDPIALADAVERLHGDSELRLRLADAGGARVRELTLEGQAERAATFLAG